MIPDSLFHIVQDAGHLVIEEQPDQLIEKIRPFLRNENIKYRDRDAHR
jgi:pimeloyl-ACP methyl ester carboxylesterase